MDKQRYPALYEINTRVWLHKFDQPGLPARLPQIPDTYWDYLQEKGIEYVWMMGIWKTVGHDQILKYALEDGLQDAYRYALPDWSKKDVIGSPYAIDQYEPAAGIGSWEDLAGLRDKLHARGMRLILDFVPNHFHAESSLIADHPGVFLPGEETHLESDPATFYRHDGKIWAHGRDPYFPAWKDTIQVNYFDNRARDFMSDQLMKLGAVCDGVRCDMAMLMLNTVFESTWRHTTGFADRNTEFWDRTISRVKAKFPDFHFIAEAYWDLEWQLQQLGFDYTYDKRLLDRLHEGNVGSVRGHLFADPDFRDRSVRFLENHDEDRILSRVNTREAEAAAVITYTLPGMRFFHDGQWEGKRVRLPVQLGREPLEAACTCVQSEYLYQQQLTEWIRPVCKCTYAFYEKLLQYLQKPIFQKGTWEQIEVEEGQEQILAWKWQMKKEHLIVVVNYSNQTVPGRLSAFPDADKLKLSEPWRALSYPHSSLTLEVKLYPYEYRFIEYTAG
ncbi:alpha-amylase family glycosyl hydrolase [Flavilitoribacter nigricans]|uniref:Glycosidase n=1 Tax=Flavilitoribacter nigricans (strain ATCC 23147 / DSM 23189 / NBRC 102662 / NCIMB 1420 / SS-2) TaxID=1122177 RepID=A0A2D0NJX7_FLAN2|nr:alpha-amylase family glycosyl hydrolase [Flavilitoribacter nigricans]PHN08043.1 glycosidase [Flavilitoribacter nigricans DSM 23189 = NBRC 102662]